MTLLDGSIIRRARKTWKCQARHARFNSAGDPSMDLITDHVPACPVVIPKGLRYVEYVAESHAYESGVRYSLACAETHLREST